MWLKQLLTFLHHTPYILSHDQSRKGQVWNCRCGDFSVLINSIVTKINNRNYLATIRWRRRCFGVKYFIAIYYKTYILPPIEIHTWCGKNYIQGIHRHKTEPTCFCLLYILSRRIIRHANLTRTAILHPKTEIRTPSGHQGTPYFYLCVNNWII